MEGSAPSDLITQAELVLTARGKVIPVLAGSPVCTYPVPTLTHLGQHSSHRAQSHLLSCRWDSSLSHGEKAMGSFWVKLQEFFLNFWISGGHHLPYRCVGLLWQDCREVE